MGAKNTQHIRAFKCLGSTNIGEDHQLLDEFLAHRLALAGDRNSIARIIKADTFFRQVEFKCAA